MFLVTIIQTLCHILDVKGRMDLETDVVSMQQHLKRSAYNDQISALKAELTEIGMTQGWTMDDLRKRLLDQRWDKILYS